MHDDNHTLQYSIYRLIRLNSIGKSGLTLIPLPPNTHLVLPLYFQITWYITKSLKTWTVWFIFAHKIWHIVSVPKNISWTSISKCTGAWKNTSGVHISEPTNWVHYHEVLLATKRTIGKFQHRPTHYTSNSGGSSFNGIPV